MQYLMLEHVSCILPHPMRYTSISGLVSGTVSLHNMKLSLQCRAHTRDILHDVQNVMRACMELARPYKYWMQCVQCGRQMSLQATQHN
jgi:hypothetical protein